jgi:L-ribulose-5-phosphate 3-epimerase
MKTTRTNPQSEEDFMADRLTGSTNTYHSYSLEEALAGIAGAGFKSVELTSVPGWTEHVLRDSTDEQLGYVKDLLAQNGLTAVSLAGHSDLVSKAGSAEFRKALKIANKLGIGMVTTSTGGHDASSAGSVAEQREAFLKNFRPLADEAAELGIVICLETHGGLLATGAISTQLVADIGKANVGINYDPGNVIFYGDTRPETDILVAAPNVVHMHAKDQIGGAGVWNFPQTGTGEVDFAPIFAALDAVGFNGPVSVEIEFTGEPWPPLADINVQMKASHDFLAQFVKD